MPQYRALIRIEFHAADHDAANEIAWMAKTDIEETYGGMVTFVNDQCEEIEVAPAEYEVES